MNQTFTQKSYGYVAILLFAFCGSINLSAQTFTAGFEGITPAANCTNTACNHIDTNTAAHALSNTAITTVVSPGSGSTLGFTAFFTPNGPGSEGLSDPDASNIPEGDSYGVVGNALLNNDFGLNAFEGTQAYIQSDPDGDVTLTFDPVSLNNAVNPTFSMHYLVDVISWEVEDYINIRIQISNCAGATTVTLLNTTGQDINDLNIEGAWRQLTQNLSAYVDCEATLLVSFMSDSNSENFAIDNIIFEVPVQNCTDPTITSIGQNPNFSVCPSASVIIEGVGQLNGSASSAFELRLGSPTGDVISTDTPDNAGNFSFTINPARRDDTYFVTALNCDGSTFSTSYTLDVNGELADAGPDQFNLLGTSTFLEGSDPAPGTGMWTIVSGDGNGFLGDASSPTSTFIGTAGQSYELSWTVFNAPCATTSDQVEVSFAGPTTLMAGDIAFTGYNSTDPDEWSFVFLADVGTSTTINFTDNGWLATGEFRSGEGTVAVSLFRNYPCGSELYVSETGANTFEVFDTDGNVAGLATVVGGVPIQTSTTGDQLFAYQGNVSTPTLLAGIQMNGDWDADAADTNTSAQPAALTGNNASLAIDPERNNAQYDCSTTEGDPADLLAAIHDPSNWNTNDATSFDLSADCPITSCVGCTEPVITSVGGAGEYCIGDMVTLTVTGDLGDAADWFWYVGGCGAGTVQANGTTITVEFNGDATYFVRGEGNCTGTDNPCMSVALTSDATPPTISCPGTISPAVLGFNCTNTLPDYTVFVVTDDNCDMDLTLSQTPAPSTIITGAQTVEVTVTATDDAGLSTSCTYTVPHIDISAPEITACPPPQTFYVDDNCEVVTPDFTTLDGTELANSSVEFSGVQGQDGWTYGRYAAFDVANFSQLPVFTGFVWNTQGEGNILDFAQLDPNGGHPQFEDNVWAVRRWTSDYDGDVTLSGDFFDRDGNCGDGANVRIFQNGTQVYEFLDISTTSTAYSVDLTVAAGDEIDFAIDPKFGAACDDTHFQSTITVNNGLAVSDNCGVVNITQTPAPGDMLEVGDTSVMVIAFDAAGNSDTCTIDLVVADTIPPMLTCQNFSYNLDANGEFTINDSIAEANIFTTLFDACGTDFTSFGVDRSALFTCDDVGENIVTFNISDVNGNESSCTAAITIVDNSPPVLTCPTELIVYSEPDGCELTVDLATFVSAADNCNPDPILSYATSAMQVPNNGISGMLVDTFVTNPDLSQLSQEMVLGPDGNIYVGIEGAGIIVKRFNGATGAFIDNFVPTGILNNAPLGMAFGPDGNLYISDGNNPSSSRVLQIDGTTGAVLNTFNPPGGGSLWDLTIGPDGFIYVARNGGPTGNDVLRIDPATGNTTIFASNPNLTLPFAITFGPDGNLYVPDSFSGGDIYRFDGTTGNLIDVLNTGFGFPNEFFFGNDGLFYLISQGIVRRLDGTTFDFLDTFTNPPADLKDMFFGPDGLLYVLNNSAGQINRWAPVSQSEYIFPLGSTSVTATATDNGGLMADCTFNVTVLDTISPSAVCQDIEIFIDGNGMGALNPADLDGGSTDNCGTPTFSASQTTFNCDDVTRNESNGDNTPIIVTLTAEDASGNMASCTSAVTVRDTISPVLECQDITFDLDADGNYMLFLGAIETIIIQSNTDNCDVITGQGGIGFQPQQFLFTCDDLGDNTFTIINNDVNGNQNTCDVTITIADPGMVCNQPPVAVCRDFTVFANNDCEGIAVAEDFDDGSSDPDMDMLTFSLDNNGPFPLGTTDVVLTVTDPNMASDMCDATITVIERPVNCPNDTILFLDETGMVNLPNPEGVEPNMVRDTFFFTGGLQNFILPAGLTEVTIEAVGGNGGDGFDVNVNPGGAGAMVTGTFDVSTFNELQIVVAGAGQDATEYGGGGGGGTFVAAGTTGFSDFIPTNVLIIAGGGGGGGGLGSGTSDATAPGAASTQLQASANGNGGAGGSTDPNTGAGGGSSLMNGGSVASGPMGGVAIINGAMGGNINQDFNPGAGAGGFGGGGGAGADGGGGGGATGGDGGDFMNVSDADGGDAGTSFVLGGATAGPSPNPRDDGNGYVVISYQSQGLEALIFSQNTFDCTVLDTQIPVTAMREGDACMTTCTFNVTVRDTVAPLITCRDTTISLDATGLNSIEASSLTSSSDNCSVTTTAPVNVTFDCDSITPPGSPRMVTVITVDGSGNADTCTVNVTVEDNTPPVLVCTTDTTVFLGDDGTFDLDAAGLLISASDNCSLVDTTDAGILTFDCEDVELEPIIINPGNGDGVFPGGGVIPGSGFLAQLIPNAVTVSDGTNSSSCTVAVTVRDTTPPAIVCLDTTIFLDALGMTSVEAMGLIESSDNCGIDSVSDFTIDMNCDSVTAAGTFRMFDLTSFDVNGNEATCTVNITVLDTIAPVLECSAITVALDSMGMAMIENDTALDTLFDNCDMDPSGPFTVGGPTARTFDCSFADSTFMRTVVASDMSGNQGSCTYEVTVIDTIAPVLECSPITVALDSMGMAMIENDTALDTLFDNCDMDPSGPFTVGGPDARTFDCTFADSTFTRTVVATDMSGNQGSCTYEVTVLDTIAPVIVCRDTIVQLDALGAASVNELDLFEAEDACGVDLSDNDNEIDLACTDVNNPIDLDITVVDVNGNDTTCTVTITVFDTIRPVITTFPQTITLNENGVATIDPDAAATATDACGIASLVVTQLTFSCEDVAEGVVMVPVIAVDVNDNETIDSVAVTVLFNEPELGCISSINVTLNENCQAMLVPEMVLAGNTVCLTDLYTFNIVVMDDDPSNGPIIDGCGTFQYTITEPEPIAAPTAPDPIVGFTGAFAEANWTVVEDNDGDPGDMVSVAFTATDLVLSTSSNGSTVFGNTPFAEASYMFSETGTLTFDYAYVTDDGGFDAFIIDFEGTMTPVDITGDVSTNGDVTASINPGDMLVVRVSEDDGALSGINQLTISNFLFTFPTPVTNDFNLSNFSTCWGFVNAEDKTSPRITDSIVAPEELFCVDLATINLNELGANVSRCFQVDAAGVPTQANFYQTALGRRLAMGSATGLIPGFFDGCSAMEICVNDLVPATDACDDVVITRVFTATDGDCLPSPAGGQGASEPNAPTVFSYQIIFTRPDVDSVQRSATLAEFSCSDVLTLLPINQFGNQNPVPAFDDYPFVVRADGTPVYLDETFCNLGATFEDGPRIVTCGSPSGGQGATYKFVRTWTVIDWCEVSNIRTFTQLVKVGDFDAPVITPPTQDLNFDGIADAYPLFYSTNTSDCRSIFIIPAGSATDACDNSPTVSAVIYPFGDTLALGFGPYAVGSPTFDGIPRGTHTIRYTASDDCGNESILDVPVTIGDATAPVAICEDGLNISIGGPIGPQGGSAQLCADDIDRASYDDCSDVALRISRVNDNNEPIDANGNLVIPAQNAYVNCITLTCADLGNVRVSLRVTDDGNDDGLFEFGIDNSNFCWLDVLVEDKTAPICIAPAPQTINCNDLSGEFPDDLNLAVATDPEGTFALLNDQFGTATGLDNCPDPVVTQSVVDNRNSCGVGTIVRTFTVTDGEGFTSPPNCGQLITVQAVHDYTVVFPGDQESDQCIEPDYNAVTYTEFGCDLLTVSTSIDTFSATADECYKLRITYEVLNWCEYNTLDAPYMIPRDADNDGILDMDTTVLHVVPRNAGLGDDLAYLDRDVNRANFNTIANLDNGDPNGILPGSETAGYGNDGSRGAFLYQQFIKVYDDTPPVLTFTEPEPICDNDGDCVETVELGFEITDECSPESVNVTVELDAFINPGADEVYTLADFLADGGNVTANTAMTGAGTFVTTLADLPLGTHALRIRATDGCGNTDIRLLVFTIIDCKAPTPICVNGLTATLMPDGQGGGMAAIWAVDFIASPNTDCTGPIKYAIYRDEDASDPTFPGPASSDTGLELDCDDLGPLTVRIYAIDGLGNSDYCLTTLSVQAFAPNVCDANGEGSLAGTVISTLNEMMDAVEVNLSGQNGMTDTELTTTGLYYFTGLALGDDYTVEPTHDPSINLARVSTGDIILISRHILGLQEMTGTYQLKAGDVTQDDNLNILDIIAIRRVILGLDLSFSATNSWRFYVAGDDQFAETYTENNLAGAVTVPDFIAVEMGNVTDAANAFTGSAEDGGRSLKTINIEEQTLEAGNTYAVTLRAGGLAGFQGTLQLGNGLEVERVNYAALQAGNVNLSRLAEGLIAMSYESKEAAGTELLTLEVRATVNAQLSELLSLTDRITRSEAYTTNDELARLGLDFGTTTIASEVKFALEQNSPNPFVNQTQVRFRLPSAATVQLTIQNQQGQLLRTIEIDAAAGANQITVGREQLNGATGVLTYTLIAGEFVATRKMIVQ